MGAAAFTVFAFSSLFAVIDPLGCIPFFSGLTAHLRQRDKAVVLLKALLVGLFVLELFVFFGPRLLDLFGITLNAFRVAGGIIFLGIGLDMLQSQPRRWRTGVGMRPEQLQAELEEEDEDPSITPLGIPLIAGPGSITTVMVLMPKAPDGGGELLLSAAVVGILALTAVILLGADLLIRRIGQTGLRLMGKLMGLLVTVIAVQLIMDGLEHYVSG